MPPPPPLTFRVSKRIDGFRVDVAQTVPSRRLALLGPSGAGKSLTLRLLTGIAAPDHAEIRAGQRELSALPPERRGVGYLPQRSALMPGRTLWEQATFGAAADAGAAAWWLERLGLGGLEDRLPSELSGGQQRRAALARALACRPSLLLMDEPFSALDAPVRGRLQREMRRLQREAGLTTVLVTHDHEEAALLADDVIVIEAGRVLQQGPIADVVARPASPRVAELLGVANTHRGVVARPGWLLSEGVVIAAPAADLPPGTRVVWSIPPEEIALGVPAEPGDHRGMVVDSVALGSLIETIVDIGSLQLAVRTSRGPRLDPGDACPIRIPPGAVGVWPDPAPRDGRAAASGWSGDPGSGGPPMGAPGADAIIG